MGAREAHDSLAGVRRTQPIYTLCTFLYVEPVSILFLRVYSMPPVSYHAKLRSSGVTAGHRVKASEQEMPNHSKAVRLGISVN